MTDTVIVDARGLSCPQPVLETKKALDNASAGRIEVLVDTVTSRENVARFGENAGCSVTILPPAPSAFGNVQTEGVFTEDGSLPPAGSGGR